MSKAIDELVDLLARAGARVTFDLGRDITHPCTFCAAPGPHNIEQIGSYRNGDPLQRPVCARCKAFVAADWIGMAIRHPMTLDGLYQVHCEFHRLWTSSVGKPGYDKNTWKTLDARLGTLGMERFGAGWVTRALDARTAGEVKKS